MKLSSDASASQESKMIEQLRTSLESMSAEKGLLQSAVERQKDDIQRTEREKAELNSLAEHLTDQIEALQREKSAVVDDAAAVRSKHHSDLLRELSEYKARILALENAAKVQDPQLAMYKSQVQELSHVVEALKVEKEQLSVDCELLEEKYLQVQIDLEEALLRCAVAEDGYNADTARRNGSTSSDSQSLLTENNRLREALRLLNASNTNDKALISRLESLVSLQESELDVLRAFKSQADEDLLLLRQAVDESQSYEVMIERLSGDNAILMEQMEECRGTIADLEEAHELNEEIDYAQRMEISVCHETISSLKDCIAEWERRVELKEGEVFESMQRLERVKLVCVSLKQEVSQLHSTLSSESLEVRQMAAKLRDVSSMRTALELQATELEALHSLLLSTTSLRYKYQILYARMEAIFGATSFFVEESKRASVESALVSAATTGLDACRVLAEALTVVFGLDDGLMRTLREACQPDAASLLGRLYLLLLQLQSYCVNCTIDYFTKDVSSDGASEQLLLLSNQQLIVDLKHGFESVRSVSSRLKVLLQGVVSDYRQHQSWSSYDSMMADVEDTPPGEKAQLDSFSNTSYHLVSLGEILLECEDTLAFLMISSRNIVGASGVANELSEVETLLMPPTDGGSSSSSFTIKVEFLLITINLLLDMALHQLTQTSVDGSVEATSSMRSIKRDVMRTCANIKHTSSLIRADVPTLHSHYRALLSCFGAHDGAMTFDLHCPQMLPALRSMSASFRDLTTASTPASVSSSACAWTMVYFPALTMTNIMQHYSDDDDLFKINAELREQVSALVDRFWMLLVSPHNSSSSELLQPVPAKAIAPGKLESINSLDSLPAAAAVVVRDNVRWKSRVAELKRVVMSRLSDDDEATGSRSGVAGSQVTSVDESLPLSSPRHQALLIELDIKREELQSAVRRCAELQSQLNVALVHPPPLDDSSSRPIDLSEVTRLQTEVCTLEDALHATEQRAEASEKELKLLKAQLTMQGLIQGGLSGRRGSKPSDKVSRALVDTQPGSRLVPQGVYDAAMVERMYWKGLALRRLTSSLLPLNTPSCSVGGSDTDRHMAHLKLEPLTLLANIRSSGGNSIPVPAVVAVLNNLELQLQSSSSDYSQGSLLLSPHEQYSRLYHQIRLSRPAGMRIKRLGHSDSPVRTASPAHCNDDASHLRRCSKPNFTSTTLLYRIRDD